MDELDVNGSNNNILGTPAVGGLHENIKYLYLLSRKVCAIQITKILVRTRFKIDSSKDRSLKINFSVI